ncbi:MAG: hypothetical protein COS89_00495 [Deltaproteobacteria bacterium CG07_land_8_20_14_0_80_38_7]|nr:MAG: hypothetical protein COS89_00495 [Deltaproteobacteria bacterium CG07_land_8_20_14_0_80_38_7]
MPKGYSKATNNNTSSAGYPEIELLIDSEDFNEVNEQFQCSYNKLEKISKQKKGLKKSREAKHAMNSIELVMDLFRELLTIKYQLQEITRSKTPNSPQK